jgi:hypothetical protein
MRPSWAAVLSGPKVGLDSTRGGDRLGRMFGQLYRSSGVPRPPVPIRCVASTSFPLFTALGGSAQPSPTCASYWGIGRPDRRACLCHRGTSQLNRRLNGQVAGIFTVAYDTGTHPV